MSISPAQLHGQIERSLASAYLLAGEEPLLLQEAADALRARARAEGFSEREVLQVETGFDWHRLQAAGENLSLFASRRLVELRLGDKPPDAEGAGALLAWLEKPAPDVLLIVHAGKLDKRARESAWFGAFERHGVAVYAWPVDSAELPRWIEARLNAAGLRAETEAVELLSARTEGNLLACAQEIAKLRLLCPDGRVTPARVREATADSARFDAFDLVDKVLLGRPAAALQVLDRLREEGVDAVPIIFVLASALRQLYRAGRAIESGTAPDRALAMVGVFGARQAVFRPALRRLPSEKVLDFIKEVSWVDRVAKGAARAEPWAELVKLAARLSGVPLPGPRMA
ncbi:MAG TPA: DNA polymerase III subunit delta [Nevskiales bacterium]|nr:DNA polymerase III subunit delta [Nevskiales bacterium]